MSQASDSVRMSAGFKTFLALCAIVIVIAGVSGAIYLSNLNGNLQAKFDTEKTQALADQAQQFSEQIAAKDGIIANLTTQVSEKVQEKTEEVKEALGYLIDGIYLENTTVSNLLSDREVSKLLDTKVEFDGEDYDIEESINLTKMQVKANKDDFDGDAYLIIPEGSVEYNVLLDSDLNTSLISDDTPLEFSFLGKDVKITEWDNDRVTFTQGKQVFLKEGESAEGVTLTAVLDNAVYVQVGDESKKIGKGSIGKFNDLEVKVEDTVYQAWEGGLQSAELTISNDVKETVDSGDEYADSSIWKYKISPHSIGLILSEEYTELRDELKPLSVDEKVCLPNEYICVKFNGVADEKTEAIDFDLDTKYEVNYTVVEGNFQKEMDDYDKLYINSTGSIFYRNESKDFALLGREVRVGNFDTFLNTTTGEIVIGNFTVNLDLNVSTADGKSLTGDTDYRTDFGILVSNPKDSIDDQEWSIVVPEEKLEASITVM